MTLNWSGDHGRTLLAGLLFSHSCSAAFFIQPKIACPRAALSTVSWTFLHQLAIKKMPPQSYPRVNLIDVILQLRFSLSGCIKLTVKISCHRHPVPSLKNWVQFPGPMWWKERTDLCKLSFDLHLCIPWHPCEHIHTCTCKINKCSVIKSNKRWVPK